MKLVMEFQKNGTTYRAEPNFHQMIASKNCFYCGGCALFTTENLEICLSPEATCHAECRDGQAIIWIKKDR